MKQLLRVIKHWASDFLKSTKNMVVKRYRLFRFWKRRKKYFSEYEKLKLCIGGGDDEFPGWLVTDKDTLDIRYMESWYTCLEGRSASCILAEHVFEHLTLNEARVAFTCIYTNLTEGGCFRIAVPDGYHIDKDYINMVKPCGWGDGSDDHKVLWNYNILSSMLSEVGFSVEVKQYYDEDGVYHTTVLDEERGIIHRRDVDYRYSDDNFSGNADKNCIAYTSLIIDAIK